MSLVKITKSGQVTLPAAVRERLGVKAGDYVEFASQGEVVTVRPVRLDKAAGDAELDGATTLDAVMDIIGNRARKRGLTEEKLADLIAED